METWQIILILFMTAMSFWYVGYKAGQILGRINGYSEGWRDCQAHHQYQDTLRQAAERWKFKQHHTN